MKFITCFFMIAFSASLMAQPCGINFSYDNAGNRIKRYQCWGSPNLVQNEEEILESFLDEQGVLEADSHSIESEVDSNLKHRNSEFKDISSLVVFPNPSVGQFQIKLVTAKENDLVFITNTQGQLIKSREFNNGLFEMSDQPAGTYFIIIRDELGELRTSKIVRTDY